MFRIEAARFFVIKSNISSTDNLSNIFIKNNSFTDFKFTEGTKLKCAEMVMQIWYIGINGNVLLLS